MGAASARSCGPSPHLLPRACVRCVAVSAEKQSLAEPHTLTAPAAIIIGSPSPVSEQGPTHFWCVTNFPVTCLPTSHIPTNLALRRALR